MAHNKLVCCRVNKLYCDFDTNMDSKMENLKKKIRQAAINRGNQLLEIRYNAEKTRKSRNSDVKPVKFDIEIERNPLNCQNPT